LANDNRHYQRSILCNGDEAHVQQRVSLLDWRIWASRRYLLNPDIHYRWVNDFPTFVVRRVLGFWELW
jgi:hypothetical protein